MLAASASRTARPRRAIPSAAATHAGRDVRFAAIRSCATQRHVLQPARRRMLAVHCVAAMRARKVARIVAARSCVQPTHSATKAAPVPFRNAIYYAAEIPARIIVPTSASARRTCCATRIATAILVPPAAFARRTVPKPGAISRATSMLVATPSVKRAIRCAAAICVPPVVRMRDAARFAAGRTV